MDNHPAHHSRTVRELLERMGATPLFLPPTSSFLNPIEQVSVHSYVFLHLYNFKVWRVVKEKWRNALVRFGTGPWTETKMLAELTRICDVLPAHMLLGFTEENVKVMADFVLDYQVGP